MKPVKPAIAEPLQVLFGAMIPLRKPDAELPEHLIFLVGQTPVHLQRQFSVLLWVLQTPILPIIILGKFKKLAALKPGDIDLLLHKMENHSLGVFRLLFVTLKRLIMMTYYSLPKHWKETGFHGFANKTEAPTAYAP